MAKQAVPHTEITNLDIIHDDNNKILDDIQVGKWFHMELMDTTPKNTHYWLHLGILDIHVHLSGRECRVEVSVDPDELATQKAFTLRSQLSP